MSVTIAHVVNPLDVTTGEAAKPRKAEREISERSLEQRFDRVRVRGEISGFKRAASGHLYLSLKDEKAVLDGV